MAVMEQGPLSRRTSQQSHHHHHQQQQQLQVHLVSLHHHQVLSELGTRQLDLLGRGSPIKQTQQQGAGSALVQFLLTASKLTLLMTHLMLPGGITRELLVNIMHRVACCR